MADWNKQNTIFNRNGQEGGFTWNSDEYIELKSVYDTVKISDNLLYAIAIYALSEKVKVADMLANSVFFDKVGETVYVDDNDVSVSILFETVDSFGMKDDLSDFIVQAFLEERFDLLEDLKTVASIFASDFIDVKEIVNLQTFLQTLDNLGFNDLVSELKSFFNVHDEFGMTDHNLKNAISDFLIGAIEDDDRAYDYFYPMNTLISWDKTQIQVMPEAEHVSISLPNVDGDIVESTTYKDRIFKIVSYSVDGLTVEQKESLKAHITDVLDSTKHQTKTLTVLPRGVSFDCRYTNQATISEGPSFVRCDVDLMVPPYGYDLIEQEIVGSGLLDNIEGDAPLGVCVKIKGEVSNPGFTIGGSHFSWNGTVPSGYTLFIDFDRMSVWMEDGSKNKTNEMAKFHGEFFRIDAHKSSVLVPDENTDGHIITTWRKSVLW